MVRIVFLPLEESARALFSKMLASKQNISDHMLLSSARILAIAIKTYLYLGLLFIAFGTNYTSLLLDILAGRQWASSDASTALAVYCVFIPVLGINGITEGFVHAVADQRELHRMTGWLVMFFAVYSGLSLVFLQYLQLGTAGVILANAANMLLRIVWSWSYLRQFLATNSMTPATRKQVQQQLSRKQIFPAMGVLIFYAATWLALRMLWNGMSLASKPLSLSLSSPSLLPNGIFVATGALILVIASLLTWKLEREFIQQTLGTWKQRKNQ